MRVWVLQVCGQLGGAGAFLEAWLACWRLGIDGRMDGWVRLWGIGHSHDGLRPAYPTGGLQDA